MSLRSNIRDMHGNNDRLDDQQARLYELVARLGGHFPVGAPDSSPSPQVEVPNQDNLLVEHVQALGRQSMTLDRLEQIIQQLSGYLEPKDADRGASVTTMPSRMGELKRGY